ncbi:hypothetical protein ATO8_19894 [Roseivivax marinus]|uniref:Large polyvalent protein associated domain-containing protein n=1 Tax=Roseivivax marinus TaxID=1379903 RepID=W4HDW9_9RHOB|nr:LPD29 domain-containing protein [Roseivivax marinus]ETW10894.1 hypothetical protein ATO8_19894 [Roseivivax marinus]
MTKRSPIYTATAKAWAAKPGEPVSVGLTDTAKLIRGALKAKFPRTKFSVRTSRFSGGTSIDISWTDGPTAELVDSITGPFQSGGFDGMIDMAFSVGGWLYPDGTAAFRETSGTEGSAGMVPAAAGEPGTDGAIPVRFGGKYVHTRRETTLAHMQRTLTSYAARWPGCPLAEAIKAGEVGVEPGRYGAWEYTGNPGAIRGAVGKGGHYGGDVALSHHAARRMTAA